MKKSATVVLAVLLAVGCAPKRRPMPTTDQGRACVEYCDESVSPCKNGCLWWIAVAWPVTFFCQGGCETDHDRCEQACPDMRYPEISAR